tara:strand:- start:2238 stop:3107 length:870 start_codon:yes stop_codon:yes gene_type:complete
MTKTSKHISIIGLGNISSYLCKTLQKYRVEISGVTNNKNRTEILSKLGVTVYKKNEILKSIELADSMIITAPPDSNGCPIINNYGSDIIKSNISWLGYLSSTSVYGDHSGEVIDEDTHLKPFEETALNRLKAENEVLKLASTSSINTEIFRVSGIYGPENNLLRRILSDKMLIINKQNHYFNRIHVSDIARVLGEASYYARNNGIVNLSDDLPASQLDVIKYAYDLLNLKIPKVEEYENIKHTLKPSIIRFWKNNRKVNNNLLKNRYGPLIYPTYKEGLKCIYNLLIKN